MAAEETLSAKSRGGLDRAPCADGFDAYLEEQQHKKASEVKLLLEWSEETIFCIAGPQMVAEADALHEPRPLPRQHVKRTSFAVPVTRCVRSSHAGCLR